MFRLTPQRRDGAHRTHDAILYWENFQPTASSRRLLSSCIILGARAPRAHCLPEKINLQVLVNLYFKFCPRIDQTTKYRQNWPSCLVLTNLNSSQRSWPIVLNFTQKYFIELNFFDVVSNFRKQLRQLWSNLPTNHLIPPLGVSMC